MPAICQYFQHIFLFHSFTPSVPRAYLILLGTTLNYVTNSLREVKKPAPGDTASKCGTHRIPGSLMTEPSFQQGIQRSLAGSLSGYVGQGPHLGRAEDSFHFCNAINSFEVLSQGKKEEKASLILPLFT